MGLPGSGSWNRVRGHRRIKRGSPGVPHGSKAELTLVLGQGAAIGIFAVTATRPGFPLRYYVVPGGA